MADGEVAKGMEGSEERKQMHGSDTEQGSEERQQPPLPSPYAPAGAPQNVLILTSPVQDGSGELAPLLNSAHDVAQIEPGVCAL